MFEVFQALGEQFVVYTLLRLQSGEVRRYRSETLTLLALVSPANSAARSHRANIPTRCSG